MEFFIEPQNKINKSFTRYTPEEYSFDTEPVLKEMQYNLVLNQLNLTVDSNDCIKQVWGLCPHTAWIEREIVVPLLPVVGDLKVKADLTAGLSYQINPQSDWPVYFSRKTGWVCIGNLSPSNTTVRFLRNCIATIVNDKLVALWIKLDVQKILKI